MPKGRKVSLAELLAELPATPTKETPTKAPDVLNIREALKNAPKKKGVKVENKPSPWKPVESFNSCHVIGYPVGHYTLSSESQREINKDLCKKTGETMKRQKQQEIDCQYWQERNMGPLKKELRNMVVGYEKLCKSLSEKKSELFSDWQKYAPTYTYTRSSGFKYAELLKSDEEQENYAKEPMYMEKGKILMDFKREAKRRLDAKYDEILGLEMKIIEQGRISFEMFNINREFDIFHFLQFRIPLKDRTFKDETWY